MGAQRLIMPGAHDAGLPPPRRERNAAETRRRILDAAEEEFAAKGYDGARLGAIARSGQVQQALIHHYFDDKAGLYRAVVTRALDALSTEGWEILTRVKASIPPPAPSSGRAPSVASSRAVVARLVDAFIGSMLRFYASHRRVLAILRLEAERSGEVAPDVVKTTVKPVLDAVVALFEELRDRGELRADLDGRAVCMSAIAMAAWPFHEERFLKAAFGFELSDPAFLARCHAETVATLLARILPSEPSP